VQIGLAVHHGLDANTGAPGSTLQLARRYREQGHGVELFSFDGLPRVLPERARALVFPVWLAFRLALRRRKLSVLDATTGDAALLLLLPRRLRRFPIITRSRGVETLAWRHELFDAAIGRGHISFRRRVYMELVRLPMVRLSLRRADGVAVPNAEEAQYVVRVLGRDPSTVFVLGNGVPSDLVSDPRPTRNGSLGVAFVGTYIARKGVHDLAAAMTKFMGEHPESRLGLFGTGAASHRALSDYPSDLHGRISVVPRFERSELPELLSSYDVLVFPSVFEGQGVALLEAMACGLVPIASDTAGPRTVVDHGINGLLVPARDPDAIESALTRLDNDPSLRQALRARALKTASENTWETIAAGNLEFYARVISAQSD
jgi:glycosyltransferase involved in cell wall biosynthesis